MHIAIDIDGQFEPRMTGIQHYTDSLLGALYALSDGPGRDPRIDSLTAFAPALSGPLPPPGSPDSWVPAERDGGFAWRAHPRARIASAGSAAWLAHHPKFGGGGPVLRRAASAADRLLLRPAKRATLKARVRRATSGFDVLHVPVPLPLVEHSRARVHTAMVHDMITRLFPETHDRANIENWERFFSWIKDRGVVVLANSENTRRDVIEHLGLPEERVMTTLLAPRAAARRMEDPAARAPFLDALPGLGAGAPFVLYGGTLEPRKNLPPLVRAFARLVRQERLPDHRLVLAGGNWGGHDKELLRLAEDEGVGGRVLAPGYQSEESMNALMSACEAFAYVSRYEGFGMPPLEAMVCGAPVVVSGVSSLPEVVGDAGLLVSPDDVDGIADALRRLLTDREENARRRRLSRERAALFTWERTARATLDAFERALAAASA